MSVLVKGMEMPPSCRYCEFRHMSLTQNAFCTAAHETIDYMDERTKRLDNCPLIQVPPHGRLIDADAIPWIEGRDEHDNPVYLLIKNCMDVVPTIIPEEPPKEEA